MSVSARVPAVAVTISGRVPALPRMTPAGHRSSLRMVPTLGVAHGRGVVSSPGSPNVSCRLVRVAETRGDGPCSLAGAKVILSPVLRIQSRPSVPCRRRWYNDHDRLGAWPDMVREGETTAGAQAALGTRRRRRSRQEGSS